MIILINTEKAGDKIPYPFMIKILNKVSRERIYINTVKAIMTNSQLTSHPMVTNEFSNVTEHKILYIEKCYSH